MVMNKYLVSRIDKGVTLTLPLGQYEVTLDAECNVVATQLPDILEDIILALQAENAALRKELEEARKDAKTFESSYDLSVRRLALMRRYVDPKMMEQLDEAWRAERREFDAARKQTS